MSRRRAAVALALLVLSTCTLLRQPADQLPTSGRPCSAGTGRPAGRPDAGDVTPVGDDVLVGGFVGADTERTPALARGSAGDSSPAWQPVPLATATPYGKVAALTSLATGDGSVTALGAAHGGAHANFRWTVWTGTPAGLVDRPQTFETFGGQEAGSLLAVVRDRVGPLIVGTWQGARGPGRCALARRRRPLGAATDPDRVGRHRRPAGAPRAPPPRQRDGSVTIDGSVIDLSDGVRQSAAVWRGSGYRLAPVGAAGPGSAQRGLVHGLRRAGVRIELLDRRLAGSERWRCGPTAPAPACRSCPSHDGDAGRHHLARRSGGRRAQHERPGTPARRSR